MMKKFYGSETYILLNSERQEQEHGKHSTQGNHQWTAATALDSPQTAFNNNKSKSAKVIHKQMHTADTEQIQVNRCAEFLAC